MKKRSLPKSTVVISGIGIISLAALLMAGGILLTGCGSKESADTGKPQTSTAVEKSEEAQPAGSQPAEEATGQPDNSGQSGQSGQTVVPDYAKKPSQEQSGQSDASAGTYAGQDPNQGVGDTSIYDPIESFDVETPDINTVTPGVP